MGEARPPWHGLHPPYSTIAADPPWQYTKVAGEGGRGKVGGKCWSDCTYLAADEGYDMLLSGGESRVWVWLAEKWLPDVVKATGAGYGQSRGDAE